MEGEAVNFPERDDLPHAPGLENLGPFGSIAAVQGRMVHIARSTRRYSPGATTTTDQVELLREAARFVAGGIVIVSHHTHAGARDEIVAWVDGTIGAPRVKPLLGPYEELRQYDGVELAILDASNVITCADEARLETLLSTLPFDTSSFRPPRQFEPARYAFEAIASEGIVGRRLGSLRVLGPHRETFTIHSSEGACMVHGTLEEAFPTRFRVGRGGRIGTIARHGDRFAEASRYGEWQPGLRDPERLRIDLTKEGVSEALARTVMHADEVIGGFRGNRGIDLLAPWAGCVILHRTSANPDFWGRPRHPYNGAWFVGWAQITQFGSEIYVDGDGVVWASWQRPEEDAVEIRRIGTSIENWFERQLFLLEHGYASERMCRPAECLPEGLEFCQGYSDATAQVYLDRSAEAVWLVEERGIQRMSRKVATLEDVLEAAARDE